MKRASPAAAAADGGLRRAHVRHGALGGRRGERLADDLGQHRDGSADDRELRALERLDGDPAAVSTAPRSPATRSASGSGSQPATCSTPARFAPSPTEAPISPVPTSASRETIVEA